MSDKIEVENVGQPGKTYRVDAAKYGAMRKAVLKVLPAKGPGMEVADVIAAVKPHLPDDLFPGGDKAGWWVKSVQLDLEAKNGHRAHAIAGPPLSSLDNAGDGVPTGPRHQPSGRHPPPPQQSIRAGSR